MAVLARYTDDRSKPTIKEALRDLVERGLLRQVNAHWELSIPIDELTVPLRVQETLQARLDRLAPATREVATAAAVNVTKGSITS